MLYFRLVQYTLYVLYYCFRAAAYSKLDRHNDAVSDCRRALQMDPNYSKAYGRMG